VRQNILLKNGRGDKLESDDMGVSVILEAGYDSEAMIMVMQILKAYSNDCDVPGFQSTNPDPENRIAKIKESDAKYKNQNISQRST
jgi:predicted Zn-dependent protease